MNVFQWVNRFSLRTVLRLNDDMKDRMRMLIPPLPYDQPRKRPAIGDQVVLLHGLWRSVWAMEGMAEVLNSAGFETINIPYASFRKTIPEMVAMVAAELRSHVDGRKVHFVTHSMGGIVLRQLAACYPELVTGRIVMLAPPNQGSEIIDWLGRSPFKPFAELAFGPGGMGLATSSVRNEVPGFSDEHEVSVVMGCKTAVPFFGPLLGGENDGIVSVAGGVVKGMKAMEVIEADHTFMMAEKVTREKVLQFLKNGVDA